MKVSFDVINKDIACVICGFLQFGDIYQLSNVNKNLKSYSLLFYFVKNKLKEKNIILPEGFAISGSYLLNILSKFDNECVPEDIDFYTNLNPSDDVTRLFEQQGYTSVKIKQTYSGNCKFIDKVQTFTKNNSPKIDIIFINNQTDVHGMIEENFDMTCVKNWYDGKQLYIKDIVNTTGIGPNGKLTKLENYKNSYWQRYLKYLMRGYTIDSNSVSIRSTIRKIINVKNFKISYFDLIKLSSIDILMRYTKQYVKLDKNNIIVSSLRS